MRTVFMGTPAFAVPTLEALLAAGHEVLAVYTQPDRPKGRGRELASSPVKECALRHGLPVMQPERVRRPEVQAALAALAPDCMVVVGYGQIIPQAILDIPPLGIVNVHASLLPAYRGAAPIQWAIANGDRITGVTTMRIDAGLDTGDMLLKTAVEIPPDETAPQLSARLAELGARLLIETLAGLAAGTLQPEPQNAAAATLAPILTREDGLIRWEREAAQIVNRLRGFDPWPGGYTTLRGHTLQITRARATAGADGQAPGAILAARKTLLVQCGGATALEVLELQPQGRKRMPAEAFLNGYKLQPGELLGH